MREHEDNLTPGFPDYYIFFRNENDTWSKAINMGTAINAPGTYAISAYVTRDGKYLFFASHTGNEIGDIADPDLGLSAIQEYESRPMNGRSDIYWVDAGIIKDLKKSLN